MDYLAGVAAALLFWFICSVMSGFWNPLKLVEGQDGRASVSKLQWFLWTAVIAFSYVTIYTAKALEGNFAAIENWPVNILLVMGFSSGTMIAAKRAAVAYTAKGRVIKTQGTGAKPSDLIKDDSGFPDLSKAQMLTWTFIAIAVYIAKVVDVVNDIPSITLVNKAVEMPDIAPALMVLMGLSQGAYIGKKLTTTTTPRITGLAPGAGAAGTSVRIIGLQFGNSQNGSLVAIEGNPIAVEIPSTAWKDTEITFTLPPINLAGVPERRIMVSVIVNAQESNAVPFTVTA